MTANSDSERGTDRTDCLAARAIREVVGAGQMLAVVREQGA